MTADLRPSLKDRIEVLKSMGLKFKLAALNGVFSASVCGRFFRGFTGIFLAKQPVPEPGGRVVDFERVIPA